MIEVRSPLPDELDEMLAVMCEAFHLPFGPARDVFYRDPYFDVRRKRVLLAGGRIVSCLTMVDAPLWIGNSVVSVAGVAGVATRPEVRNRGHATRLLVDAIPVARELGHSLAALYAITPSFYRRIGWEQGATQVALSMPPPALPATREGRYVRAALPSDIPDLLRLYDAWSEGRTGCRVRDDRRWRYLFEHAKYRVVFKRAEVEGYALYDTRDEEGHKPSLRVLEIVTNTEAAQRGLHTHFGQRSDCEAIEMTAGWRELGESGLVRAAGLAADDFSAAGALTMVNGPLFHLVDFRRCVEEMSAGWPGLEGTVTLALRERPADRKAVEILTLRGGEGPVEVHAGTERDNPRARIEGDATAWTSVLVGALSLADAVALGRLRATSEGAVARAAALFPRRELAIPAADHF